MQTGEDKRAARTRALARRAAAFADHGAAAGARLAEHGLSFLDVAPGAIVSGFSAIRDEIDAGALLARLHGEGFRLCLPVMEGKALPLIFRAWSPGDAMGKAQWGIAEPLPDKPVLEPDVILVPLLAFDAAGHRLGYGGGFYDTSFAFLGQRQRPATPLLVGVGYSFQEVDTLAPETWDVKLDLIATERELIDCTET